MQYSDFQGLKISRLGFGLMRLPLRADKTVDEEQCAQLFDYAVSVVAQADGPVDLR